MSDFTYARKPRHPGIPGDPPYEVESFAEKYGMTLKAAKVVLYVNGPSRVACDAAARAFSEAVEMRNKQWQRDKQETP